MEASELASRWEDLRPDLSPHEIAARIFAIYLEAHRQGEDVSNENLVDLQKAVLTRRLHDQEQFGAASDLVDDLLEKLRGSDKTTPQEFADVSRRVLSMAMKLMAARREMDALL